MSTIKKKSAKNLLERFSCILGKSGKKITGHKLLLKSLFVMRENINFNDLLKDISDIETNKKLNDVTNFYFSNQKENFFGSKEFLILLSSLSFQNKSLIPFQPNGIFSISSQITEQNAKQVRQEKNKVDTQLFGIKSLQNKSLCLISIENVKPILETRKIRKGRVTYQVPLVTSSQRQFLKGISLLIENANLRKENESRRLSSSSGDHESFLQKTEKIENKKHLTTQQTVEQTLLFSPQILTSTSFGNTSPNNNFFILPSHNKFSKTKYKNVVTFASSSDNFLQSQLSERLALFNTNPEKLTEKARFLGSPEKKHFLPSLRKPNIKYCLSEQLIDSITGKGGSVEKKRQLHKLAVQNRAYLHFRWW